MCLSGKRQWRLVVGRICRARVYWLMGRRERRWDEMRFRGARYFWSEVLKGAAAAAAMSRARHHRTTNTPGFVSEALPTAFPQPPPATDNPTINPFITSPLCSPAPISVLHKRLSTTSAKAGNIPIRTNLSTLPKPSQALLIHTRDRKPHQSKADSTAWRRDIHYRNTGWLSVSPTSHRLQSLSASH
jgi:hypothetical protein